MEQQLDAWRGEVSLARWKVKHFDFTLFPKKKKDNMSERMPMIKSMALEFFNGLMAGYTLEAGKKENSMV